jgi:predicted DNA-binding transcriptional regulator AlpA
MTKLIDRATLKAKGICFNASTLWRKSVTGEFPKPVLVGNRNMWVEAEVDRYIDSLLAKRDTVPAGEERNAVAA